MIEFIVLVSIVVIFLLYWHGTNNSVEVDSKIPFIYGDYDEWNDPTKKHERVFCKNCAFYNLWSLA